MENLKKVIVLILAVVVSSCLFDKQPKDVDPFYTTRNFGQFPVMPLVKPVKLICDDQSKKWDVDIPDYFKQKISRRYLYNSKIGVDSTCIYGRLIPIERHIDGYKEGDNIYMYNDGIVTWTKEKKELNDAIRLIKPPDIVNKTFTEPERWFIINVADSTTEAFFSEKKYKDYLQERGISGTMYNIEECHKQFIETGILPWFPDSVKIKLKK